MRVCFVASQGKTAWQDKISGEQRSACLCPEIFLDFSERRLKKAIKKSYEKGWDSLNDRSMKRFKIMCVSMGIILAKILKITLFCNL